MAPSTRLTNRESTPEFTPVRREHDTIKKSRFFSAWDLRGPEENISSISRAIQVPRSTAQRWLHQRSQLGSPAYRSTRQKSTILGRHSRVTKSDYELLLSPSRNKVRDQPYAIQLNHHQIDIQPRALRVQLRKHTDGAQLYKQAYIGKQLSAKNRAERTDFGHRHIGKSIDDYWQYIIWTDEFHIDPSSKVQGRILRERRTRYRPENIQERGPKEGNQLHCAGWVNWHAKCDKLIFYNDEKDETIQPPHPPKPRKSKFEDPEQFQVRMDHWEASKPHKRTVKPKGNAMTQEYYTKNILPSYIHAVHELRLQECGLVSNWLLQEDGDPSHGIRSYGLAKKLKHANWIGNHYHPAQSPDLNPIEACWNILKQRLRRRRWDNLEELKRIVQEE